MMLKKWTETLFQNQHFLARLIHKMMEKIPQTET